MSWLQDRVRKVSKVLRQKNIHVTPGATSATFVTSSLSNDNVDEGKNNGNNTQYIQKCLSFFRSFIATRSKLYLHS